MGNPSQNYGASPALWDHTVLPATCFIGSHSVTCYPTQVNGPALTAARQAGTRLDGRLGVGYILRWSTCLQTVTHPSSNHLIVTQLGVELWTV